MTTLLLLLGGSGTRFGSGLPKQYLAMTGSKKPIFQVTCERLLNHLKINHVVLCLAHQYVDNSIFSHALAQLGESYPQVAFNTAPAGDTRHKSFRNALAHCPVQTQIVMVHDANRPFLTDLFLSRVQDAAEKITATRPAMIPTVPVTDSLVAIDDTLAVRHYVNREQTRAVQTPQIFLYSSLIKASHAMQASFTDEGSLMAACGHRVVCFEGDIENRKITYPQDL